MNACFWLELCVSSVQSAVTLAQAKVQLAQAASPKEIRNRRSHQRFSMKKGDLRNFTKFTGKHQCQSLFFNKVTGLRPATLKKETLVHVFSCEFFEVLKNTFFTECLLWMTAIGNQETQESAITRSRNGHLDLTIQQYQIFRGCPQNISGQFN